MPRPRARASLAAFAAVLAGCAGTGGGAAADGPITVSAASSLRGPLSACVRDARLQFGGSDDLAAQARRGTPPDLLAAADVALTRRLADEGVLEPPVAFASNELVLAVPAGGRVRSIEDVGERGVSLAIGAEGVPAGEYARAALDRLPARRRRAVLANVRSEEPDVKGVVAKLAQGAVDAGLVYATDVRAAPSALRAIPLPRRLRPPVTYGASVGRDAPRAARALLEDLRSGRCQASLRAAGFGPPPP